MDRVVIAGSTGFGLLKFFFFDCDGMSCLRFEAGTMPKLGKLLLALDRNKWDVVAPEGLKHLSSLTRITVWMLDFTIAGNLGIEMVKRVFQDAVDGNPNRLAIDCGQACPSL
ncbi:hypothetical protein ACP4OV_018488 [Aristida adscensionis]